MPGSSAFDVRESSTGPGGVPGPVAYGIVLVWFAAMVWVGTSGVLRTLPSLGPLSPLQVAILLPVALFAVAARWNARVRERVLALDTTWLVGVQVLRVLGCSHLVTWGLGLMAGGFALPVALGNLVVSLFALSILPGVSARRAAWERRVRVLSFVGLGEFAMTIGLAIAGFLSLATPLDPPMALAGFAAIWRPPISLFPTFLIPLFSIIHVATLIRIGRPAPGSR